MGPRLSFEIRQGDALALLKAMPKASVQTCVTSPPYWGLRDYGVAGQLGLEATPEEYVARMVEVFREVRRVLRDDGTLWLNLGDSYCSTAPGTQGDPLHRRGILAGVSERRADAAAKPRPQTPDGLKPKDLVGIPWRVAFALQADGWWLRSDIVWHKPNPMPESVTDRPTKAHEYVFLLAAGERYLYDAKAIAEPTVGLNEHDLTGPGYHAPGQTPHTGTRRSGNKARTYGGAVGDRTDDHLGRGVPRTDETGSRNRRSVWAVATEPFPEAHFATFPQALVEPCVLAGSRPQDLVLDPFAGSGTVGVVALRHGRRFLGLELNPAYVEMARRRIAGPLFAEAAP